MKARRDPRAEARRSIEHQRWLAANRLGVATPRAATIPDKRKQQSRNACRGKVQVSD